MWWHFIRQLTRYCNRGKLETYQFIAQLRRKSAGTDPVYSKGVVEVEWEVDGSVVEAKVQEDSLKASSVEDFKVASSRDSMIYYPRSAVYTLKAPQHTSLEPSGSSSEKPPQIETARMKYDTIAV
jgi:hypothetical protein